MTKNKSKCHKFIDIGANLTDPRFFGNYHGSVKHTDDLEIVIARANSLGVDKILVTGGSLFESKEAINICEKSPSLFATVGCHPTRCNEFLKNPPYYLQQLEELVSNNLQKVVALGEMGLDYDRTQFCSIEVQKKYFLYQLDMYSKFKLPLFLHSRACADGFESIIRNGIEKHGKLKGVVHSFTGGLEEARSLIDLGFFIGVNGCSLKTEENLEVIRNLPLDKLMIETDAPWCEIRNTHASHKYVQTLFPVKKAEKWDANSFVKGRNEPAATVQVFEVLCALHSDKDPTDISETLYSNTFDLFFASNENLNLYFFDSLACYEVRITCCFQL
ncbi:hypothetical protein Ciccas_001225 [Cichlidogyrus casuarinus]|uniref:Deoxyribonuclease TATDN1 n=1 Tax=Cichlidogyrus casuarinus TaxID=1844966 RepID=A0ABD2QKL1_9PLAT